MSGCATRQWSIADDLVALGPPQAGPTVGDRQPQRGAEPPRRQRRTRTQVGLGDVSEAAERVGDQIDLGPHLGAGLQGLEITAPTAVGDMGAPGPDAVGRRPQTVRRTEPRSAPLRWRISTSTCSPGRAPATSTTRPSGCRARASPPATRRSATTVASSAAPSVAASVGLLARAGNGRPRTAGGRSPGQRTRVSSERPVTRSRRFPCRRPVPVPSRSSPPSFPPTSPTSATRASTSRRPASTASSGTSWTATSCPTSPSAPTSSPPPGPSSRCRSRPT